MDYKLGSVILMTTQLLRSYEESIFNSCIINTAKLEYYTYIRIPFCMSNHISLFEVSELYEGTDESIIKDITWDNMHPWLRIKSDILNKNPGLHIYRFRFVDLITDDAMSLYWTYRIQTDCPDKSYVYMER